MTVPRIVAGRARGRRIAVPAAGTRPTSDRVREALFSALEARIGDWAGVVVLDLYAGSGALGLEALSRGAARAVLVERDARALAVLRANVRAVGLAGAEVVGADVARWARRSPPPEGRGADLVLADPPYDLPDADLATVLARLLAAGWVAAGAGIVVERAARGPAFAWPPGIVGDRDRRYGETVLWYGHEDRLGPPAAG